MKNFVQLMIRLLIKVINDEISFDWREYDFVERMILQILV